MIESEMNTSVTDRKHIALLGVDSDGCVFDTMGLKHRECFCPAFIGNFGLQSVSKAAREVWEFVNLESSYRGINRFKAVLISLSFLKDHPEVLSRGFIVPDLPLLQEWVLKAAYLGEGALQEEIQAHPSDELSRVLSWSRDLNAAVEKIAKVVAPFPRVAETLKRAALMADVMVVSQTPAAAILREWTANGIIDPVWTLAGQEFGSKTEQLRHGMARGSQALMLGDAPGDLAAAREAGAQFFPIVPGKETESWKLLADEVLDAWIAGKYTEAWEADLIATFNAALPDTPVWKK